MNQSRLAGVGGVAFGVLAFVAMIVASPPGGGYKASDVTKFLSSGHRPAVFMSAYLMVIATVGLLLFLARLRSTIDGAREAIFWGLSVAAAAAWLAGFLLALAPSAALAFSGGKLDSSSITPQVGYVLSESGWAVMYGAGGVLLGAALITLVAGRVTVPAWARWSTAVAGVAAIAALAWFPFFLVYLWAIVLGIWTLATTRERAPQVSAQAA